MPKRADYETLCEMCLDKDEETESLFLFDEPITRIEYRHNRGGQGEAPIIAKYYSGSDMIFYACDRIIMHRLKTWNAIPLEGSEYSDMACVDPRIIASYIAAFWLWGIARHTRGVECWEILDELTADNYVFTREEALDWLKRNGLCVENRRERAIAIYYGEIEMDYVPPYIKPIYDRYIDEARVKIKEINERKQQLLNKRK